MSVVHCLKAPYDVYIGRGLCPHTKNRSVWANPFTLAALHTTADREDVVRRYEQFVRTNPRLLARLHELEDKVLGCWCEPGQACHGQVLIRLVEELKAKREVNAA